MRWNLWTVCLVVALGVGLALEAFAAVPLQVPVQGVLRDNAGVPVVEDAFAMTFSLYPSADADVPVWTEIWPGNGESCEDAPAACVQVLGGIFQVNLGAQVPLSVDILEVGGLWLGITVETDPELPRRPLGSAPYALHAGSSSTLACSGCVGLGQLSEQVLSALEDVVVVEEDLPPTGLDEISGGLLTNERVFIWSATDPVDIQDQFPPGISSSIVVPSEGVLLDLRVTVDVLNSDLSTVKVTLYDPTGGAYVLWDGDGPGDHLNTTWPDPQPLAQGDLGVWIGQDAAGTWSLEVVDAGFLNNDIDGQLAGWHLEGVVRSTNQVEATADLKVAGDLSVVGQATVASDLSVGGQATVAGDLIVQGAIGGPGGIVIGGGDGACDPSQNGALHYDPDTKRLFLCVGDELLKLKACSTVCPEPPAVPCGEGIEDACGDPCPGGLTGTGVNTTQCLINASGTGCNIAVMDGCGNDCGLVGSDLNLGTCSDPTFVGCDEAIIDACGNSCGTKGEGLNPAQCPAPSNAICGVTLSDACGNDCGTTGQLCEGTTECVNGACLILGQHPDLPGLSCKNVLDSGFSQGTGVYWIDGDGAAGDPAAEAHCDMDLLGGGWTLLLNLDSGDGDRKDYNRTDFWLAGGTLGNVNAYLGADYKGESYASLGDQTEVLILAHNDGGTLGHSVYPLLNAHAGKSLLTMMTTLTHTTISGAPTSQAGATGAVQNPDRPQSLGGDLFIEHAGALVVNQNSGWSAAITLNRLATTITNGDYQHTYAGLAGHHEQGLGDYTTLYESAPISSYCDLRSAYGEASNYGLAPSGGALPTDAGCTKAFTYVPADFAIFFR